MLSHWGAGALWGTHLGDGKSLSQQLHIAQPTVTLIIQYELREKGVICKQTQ